MAASTSIIAIATTTNITIYLVNSMYQHHGSILRTVSHHIATLSGRNYYHLHFIDEETEAQNDFTTCLYSQS